MKIGELSFLALRVLAVYFFVLGLNHVVNYLDYALPAYLQLLGIVLILKAEGFAKLLRTIRGDKR